jgi:hypothetical protein
MPSQNLHGARQLLLLAACASLAACAGPQKRPDVFWPPPPETARIQWVRSFSSEADIVNGTFSALGRAFLPGDSSLGIQQPTGLALSPDERTLYIASNSACKVLAVDLEKGRFRSAANADKNRPIAPFGVATDAEGNLYVTDHQAGLVFVYAPDGAFLRRIGEGKLERASGIAIDRRRQLLYVTAGSSSDSKNHRIEVFSLKGQPLRTIGTRGHEPGTFNFPANLAVSGSGELYVVDMLNFRIQIFGRAECSSTSSSTRPPRTATFLRRPHRRRRPALRQPPLRRPPLRQTLRRRRLRRRRVRRNSTAP